MTARKKQIRIHKTSSKPKPTDVFDSYWKFAVERQKIYFQRLNKERIPWTSDPILRDHKFTNAYRATDRVSQYLIKKVIYEGSQEPDEVIFRTILFKLFNKIETWEYLKHCLGELTYKGYSYRNYDQALTDAINAGEKIYSGAYIMPSGKSSFGYSKKHQNNLKLLERMLADDLPARLSGTTSMKEGYALLLAYPSLGPFLAYQYITDINYGPHSDYSEMEFVVPGPGALDGISKCFQDYGDYNQADIIQLVCEEQEKHFDRLELDFPSLWGRPLQLIDCQNLFCEISKYARIAHPQRPGISGRTRIKQKFTLTGPMSEPWFPPKWSLNEIIRLPHHVS